MTPAPSNRAPIAVFAGPSLPIQHRPDTATISWYPPAQRGDLDQFDQPPDTVVVLADGYMIHQYPPSPTEVFNLTERGHQVWGCASLGALRAAELRDHGVCGYGWVYDRIIDRTITYDDELVALLDPRTNTATTAFLVNIRFGLEQQVATGAISHNQSQQVTDALRAVHFEQRTREFCRDVANSVGIPSSATTMILAADVKQQDTRELLNLLTAKDPA